MRRFVGLSSVMRTLLPRKLVISLRPSRSSGFGERAGANRIVTQNLVPFPFPLPDLAPERDLAVHERREPAADRKTEPRAAEPPCGGAVGLPEGLEEVLRR